MMGQNHQSPHNYSSFVSVSKAYLRRRSDTLSRLFDVLGLAIIVSFVVVAPIAWSLVNRREELLL